MRHETTPLSSTVDFRGTPATESRAALPGCVPPAAVPDPAGQCARPTSRADRPAAQLCDPACAPCDPCLPHPWASRVLGPIAASPAPTCRARGWQERAVARPAARTAPGLWQTPPSLDAAYSGRRLWGAGSDPVPGQPRDDPPSAPAAGREWAAGQAPDHQPRSPVRGPQKPRHGLIRLAAQHADGVLGFVDATWWSRLAQPALPRWTAGTPLRLLEQDGPKGEPTPKALAC
jgi:hypothetical protein